ncbi:MAG: 3-oxoacyl-[acyl-carrier-protein] synthase-1/3-oxoacyl-[acyl-carrier-protein] synthase II [Cellvibrionaceae bacterium]|jgi:3-oxoacyl-[acyl-carrier-protein] synthase-1/3-oxoacyl-[acyl-carrier-protein] synthase II
MSTVAITGLGIFVPSYTDVEPLFKALYNGKSLLKKINISQSGTSPVDVICSRINDENLDLVEKNYPHLNKASVAISTKMAVHAAHKAYIQAGISADALGDRLGLFVGCNKNLLPAETLHKLWGEGSGNLNADDIVRIQTEIDSLPQNQAAHYIARELSIKGCTQSFADACTAGPTAIISAQRRILSGELDAAICGAAEYATHPIMQMSFYKLGALNLSRYGKASEASRPFDKNRSGCILADGAAFLILENAAYAKKRGATVLAYLSGATRQTEAHKPTSTEAGGMYYKKCMEDALSNAQLSIDDIQHISAHGTSTPSNDAAEGRAIASIFHQKKSTLHSQNPPTVTSTKSAMGHSLAASGAIEAVLCVQSLTEQKVLPTLNYSQPKEDEALLNIVTEGKSQALKHILSNSFGFGGENAALIFSQNNDMR